MNQEDANMFKAIENAGAKLFDLHVADNNRMACGMGNLDWKRIIDTLKSVGYDGALTVEFVAPLDRTPANPYANMLERGDVTLTPEELKFMIDHGTGNLSDEFYSWLVDETIKTLRRNM
jgi:sugar phosphate isomerase/epimerase